MIPELRETDPGQDASNPGTDEFAEDLHLPALPVAVEEYFAAERLWHRFLLGTGLVNRETLR